MILRRSRFAAVAAALAFAVSSAAFANPDAAAQREIDHLLKFVSGSACTFMRNGAEYTAAKASEHLAGKFRFAASRVATAEDFIRDLASRSSVSGEVYQVKCGNVDTPASAWLTEELLRYRKSRMSAAH